MTSGGNTTYDMTMTRTSTLRGTITPPTASGRLTSGGQQVKLHLTADGESPTRTWHANAPDITTATKVSIPASGTKRLNLTHP